MMNKSAAAGESPVKKGGFKKIIQISSTALLIICTVLCFVVVVRGALNMETSILGYRIFYVITGSMEPTIPVNSVLIVGEREDYEVGDIITFYSRDSQIKGQPNTHRIISKGEEDGESWYITQGDANPVADGDRVLQSDVIGKMFFCFSGSGVISTVIQALGTPIGFFIVVLVPILLIALACMRDFKKALTEEMRKAAMESLKEELTGETKELTEENEDGKD